MFYDILLERVKKIDLYSDVSFGILRVIGLLLGICSLMYEIFINLC